MIAPFLAFGHQLLRDHVKHGKSMLDDRAKLALQPLGHKFRHLPLITVKLHSFGARDALQILVGAWDGRRKRPVRDRLDIFHHIRNQVRILYDNFMRLLRAKVFKFLEHLVCRAEIQRRLLVGVGKAHARHQDRPEFRVARVHEMDVAGCDNRDVQPLSKPHDRFVKLPDCLLVRNHIAAHHIFVVCNRLDFQVIVKTRDIAQVAPAFPLHDRTVKLPGFTGASDQKALPVFNQLAFGDTRTFGIVIQMGN